MFAETGLTIGRLAVRAAADADPWPLRLRLERALDATDVDSRPSEAGSVLVVRALRLPLGAVRGELDRLRRVAARPARGDPSGAAPSVLFADASELVACLTRDVLAGAVSSRWYWRRMRYPGVAIGSSTPGSTLAAAWQAHARWLPAAFRQLGTDAAVAAVRLLGPTATQVVTRALQVEYGLPNVTPEPVARASHEQPHRPRDQRPPRAGRGAADVPPPPWRTWLAPHQVTELSPQAEYLVGLGLALAHRPTFARGADFTAQARFWRAATAWSSLAPPGTAAASAPERAAVTWTGVTRSQPSEQPPATGGRLQTLPADEKAAPRPRSAADRTLHATAARTAVTTPAADPRRTPDPAQSVPPRPGARLDGAIASLVATEAHGFRTEVAGVLFLVNLFTRLDGLAEGSSSTLFAAPRDRSSPAGVDFGGWTVLEMLGRALLGEGLAELEADPLWATLAALDGRPPGTRLGKGVQPRSRAFRLPAAWLRVASADPVWLAHRVGGGGLRLTDRAAGYLVADVPCAACSWRVLADSVVADYRTDGLAVEWVPGPSLPRLDQLHPLLDGRLARPARWWLTRVLGFVRHLLASMLGADDVNAGTALACLVRRRGRLVATRTHVDLSMPLEDIWLPIRRAGLDFNPGWVPALGRIVGFHYTDSGL